MKNKKIVACIKALSAQKNGYTESRKHLQSVDSSRDMRMVKLYSYLWKVVEQDPDAEINREKAFSAVFGKRSTYDKRKMMDLIHRLTAVLEDFIMLFYFKEDKTLKQKKIAEFFRVNRNDKYFFKAVEDLKQEEEKEEAKHYHIRSEINHDYYFYQSESNHHQQYGDALNEHIEDLNTFHAIRYLKASAEKLLKARIRGIPIDSKFLEKVNAYLVFMDDEPKSPLVRTLVHVLQFYLSPSLDLYFSLKNNLIENLDQLHSEKKTLLLYLINALTLTRFPKYITREYFSLFKFGVEKNLLKENGIVSSRMFNNIVIIAHTIKEYTWAENFIHSHLKYLEVSEETKSHMLKLAECFCLFGKMEYDQVLKKLEEVKNIDHSYTTRKHVLAFKTEYERDNDNSYVQIEERESSFRRLLNRLTKEKQVNRTHQDKHFNFLNLLKKIAGYRFGKYSKEQLHKILEDQTNEIIEKLWLEEKITAL